jgi:hypothetical protein
MIRKTLAAMLLALAFPAAAQSVPAANYSDIWWNPNESGWGVTFTQHPTTNQVFAVWYTYDPRAADAASPGNFKPLWLVMPGGQWTTPTHLVGDVYVTVGTPFAQNWNTASIVATKVGSFNFDFASSSAGTFAYAIAAPGGLAANDPAFGMPAFSGTKQIQRQPF